MSWKEELRALDKTQGYFAKTLLPELIEAAAEHGSSTALQLIGTTMLLSCMKFKDKVHPLGTLFDPEIVFRKVFLSNGAVENDGFWSEPRKVSLLRTVPELLLDNPKNLLQITGVVSDRVKCGCGKHRNGDITGSSTELCVIPVVLLWEQIAKLSAECRRRVPIHERDVIVRLDGLVELLRPDSGLTDDDDDWWPIEDKPLPVWSRYRAVFMLSLARSMLHTVVSLSGGLRETGGPAPITSADLDVAEQTMKEFWTANNKKYGYKLAPPVRDDLGDLNAQLVDLVTSVEKQSDNQKQRQGKVIGKWPVCRDMLTNWIKAERTALSILERVVFKVIVEELDSAIYGRRST